MKAVIAYGDGYSVCDNCRKPNRLDYISKPPIAEFHRDLAAWLNMDAVRTVPGARRGFQAVAHTYVHKGDPVVLTSLSHYTEFLAVEEAGGVAREIPVGPDHKVTADAAAMKIEEVERESGRAPVLAIIDHVDYQYGNMHDVKAITAVAHQYDIPVLYNGAYTVGILPVDGKNLGVDFVVGSGHKSMAAPAPSGILAATQERAAEVFRTSAIEGDVLLKPASLQLMWTPVKLSDGKPDSAGYGFGWRMGEIRGLRIIEHAGAWQGFTSNISRYVDDRLTVVVLANLAGAGPGAITHHVAGLYEPALMLLPEKLIEDKEPQGTALPTDLLQDIADRKKIAGIRLVQ